MIRQNSVLRSPMKEEQLVPESQFFDTDIIIDGFEGIMGNIIKHEEEEEEGKHNNNNNNGEALQGEYYMGYNWDLMDWEEFEDEESVLQKSDAIFSCKNEGEDDNDAKKVMSLNLSLNYQQVLDAWSNRASSLPADASNNSVYMGEVPTMGEDRARREASVLRYKEKRQNRLFSKKIRYEVRKLNADKRPRLKGRFVKRESREDTNKSARA